MCRTNTIRLWAIWKLRVSGRLPGEPERSRLERAAHAGDDFGALLEKHGLTSEQSQVRVLQALLSVERTAQALHKSVRQIEADFLTRILERQLRPTCSNPVCRQVIEAEQRIPLRIDSDNDCVVCRGSR